MEISLQEVRQILSEPPYDEFVPFEEYTFVSEENPSYKEVESHFGHIMMDLELNSEEKINTLEIPKDEQWKFYCDHVKDDTDIPSPAYLVECIKKKHDPLLLELLAALFARNRISYRQQFLEGDGLKLLMDYVRKFSKDPNSLDNQNSIPHVLQCLNNISNSIKFGPSYFEEYIDEIIPILMDLMVKLPFGPNFVLMLGIISGFFISPTKGPIMSNILKTVKLLKGQPPIFWSNLKKVVSQNGNNEIKILNNFTQMLILLRNNPKERFSLSIMFATNGYMKSICELSNPLFRNSIAQYDLDCEVLSQFSNQLDINPFSIKSLSKGLKENSKSKQILRFILLSLNDILKNYETASIDYETFIFIHNFLLIRRFYLSNNDKTKLLLAAFSAASNSDPIKMPYNGRNISYHQLNSNCFFLNDATLKNTKISDYGKFYDKIPEDSQIPILKQKIEEYNIYIKKLKDAHHIANAVHFEQEAILGQLTSLRTENQHLKALVASLKEKLSKYEKGGLNITERSFKEIPTNNGVQLHQLKKQVKELASQITIENEINQNLNKENIQSQLEQSNKENKELKMKFEESSNENRKLVSQVEEANNEIKDLKAKVEELQNQLEQSNAENENSKQTTKSIETQNEEDNESVSIDPIWVISDETETKAETELHQQKQALDNEIVNLQTQLEQSNNENKELRIKYEESSYENRNLVSQIENSNNEIKELKLKVEELQNRLEQSNAINENSKQTTESIEAQNEEDNESVSTDPIWVISDEAETETELQQQRQALDNEIVNLQTQLEQSNNENRKLVSQVEEANNEIKDLKAKVEELQNQLEQSNTENENSKQTIESIETQNEEDNESVSIDPIWVISDETETETKLQQQKQALDNEIVILQAQLEQSNNESKELQIKYEESSYENRNLVSQIEDSNNEIKELKLKVEELQNQLGQTSTKNEIKGEDENSDSISKTDIQSPPPPSSLQPKERDIQLQIEQSNNQNEALRAELEQSNRTIENLKKRLQLSESENSCLRNEEITNLKRQLDSQLNNKNSSSEDLNSCFDSTEFSSPIRSSNRSLTENSLILNQLASQQEQIELLRKQLSEYESRDWGQLNPSYDLHNANSDEIQNLRDELKNAKEKIEQYKSVYNNEANTDNEVIEVIKEQLYLKKMENEELKMKLESTLIEISELKERVNQINNSSNNDVNINNNNDNDNSNDNSADDSAKSSPSKRKFSFRNLLKK